AGFIGSPAMNFVRGKVAGPDAGGTAVDLEDGSRIVVPARPGAKAGDAVTVGVRPEHLSLGGTGEVRLSGTLDLVERLGETGYAYCRLDTGTPVTAEVRGAVALATGSRAGVSAAPENVHLFDAGGLALAPA
ncbi:TOBE domain-containing protein, partial [Nostoc sp. NIES-2111]